MAGEDSHRIWISRLDADALRAYARKLEGRDIASLPLYGIPFAIKDNIDLAGLPTTAGCPGLCLHAERIRHRGAAPDRRRRDPARQDQPRPVRHRL
jgi:Asp-tRNA(Asn)/Glu-tRNA(Gln) amidotransferase A subunit family amidase